MFKSIVKYVTVLAAAGVLTTASLAATAREAVAVAQIPSVSVSYADLNLDTSAGVDTLYARLRAAARLVCHVGEKSSLTDVMASRSCYSRVLAAAVGQAHVPLLTDRLASRPHLWVDAG